MLQYTYKYVKYLLNKLFFIVVTMNKIIHSSFLTDWIKYFSDDVNLYVLENNNMIRVKHIDSIDKYNANKYYVTISFSNNSNKYLVFDNKEVLKNCYSQIKDVVSNRLPNFSTYMEVINKSNNLDIIDIFNCYDDSTQTFFSDITKYSLKSTDLYDFKNSIFVVNKDDTIEITKMNLDTLLINADCII